jgi:hypothetical protein
MNTRDDGNYVPRTPFGWEVRASGFSRACPKCGMQWSDRTVWFRKTAECDSLTRTHSWKVDDGEGGCFVESTTNTFAVRAHVGCGGQMLDDR